MNEKTLLWRVFGVFLIILGVLALVITNNGVGFKIEDMWDYFAIGEILVGIILIWRF